jgi:predicted metal-dependent hydrolase
MKKLNNKKTIQILEKEYEISYQKTKALKGKVIPRVKTLQVYRGELDRKSYQFVLMDWLQELANSYIVKRTRYLAKRYGFEYKDIRVKSQKTRWGSCSSRKNLNFNWRLILAPRKCLDYVIIHELAHTKQMNHSASFWRLVEECMPDYEKYALWLRHEGGGLF